MKVKLFVMDVDGTLTDGRIYIGANGEVMKAFDVKDGYGIVTAAANGIVPVIVTGRTSDIVAARAKELRVTELHQGLSDKLACVREVAAKYGASREEIAYIGDDLNDRDCLEYCGVTGCPGDASEEVKPLVTYVCRRDGGRGAVREFIDYITAGRSEGGMESRKSGTSK